MNNNTGVNPYEVISPKRRLDASTLRVWVEEKHFSIATFKWDGDEYRAGIRWNGKDGSRGYPTSRCRPTWFIIPSAVALEYIEKICSAEQVEEFKSIRFGNNFK